VLLAYMITRPGKKLLFMGVELAPWTEWNHDASLEWNLLRDDPRRARHFEYVRRLGALYRERAEFWRHDSEWEGFSWISADDRENSVMAFVRRDGDRHAVVVMNLTPVARPVYRIGVPAMGSYREVLNSDAAEWGGSGHETRARIEAEAAPFHGFQQSIELTLPPLGVLVLAPDNG
jgi:1,4-alpha-glucan branching enzyme